MSSPPDSCVAHVKRAGRGDQLDRRGPGGGSPRHLRSFRAACQPMDTWSSCMAELGMESTDAGTASRLLSETSPACVYWAIIRPESTPGSAARKAGQTVRAGRVQHAVRAALGNGAEVRDGDGQEVQDVGHGGAVEVAVGADPAVREDHGVVDRGGEFAGSDQRGVVHGVADGAGHLRARNAASTRPGPWSRPPGGRRRSASWTAPAACCPRWRPGRGAAAVRRAAPAGTPGPCPAAPRR